MGQLKQYFGNDTRQFSHGTGNASHFSVQAAREHFGRGYKQYLYNASIVLPLSALSIWHVLTRSELWDEWMDGDSKRPCTPLPTRFGPGTQVYGFERESGYGSDPDKFTKSGSPIAVVIDGRDGSYLRIRRSNVAGDLMYVDIRLASVMRGQTEVTLELRYFHKDTSTAIGRGLANLFGQSDEEPEGHRREYTDKADRYLKIFGNLCVEIERYGFVRSMNFGDQATWFDWWYYPGTLRLYPDAKGNRVLEPGSIIESGEKLGYIYNPKYHASEREAQERYYVAVGSEPGNRFRIVETVVKDGDTIEKYDRLFAWEWVR